MCDWCWSEHPVVPVVLGDITTFEIRVALMCPAAIDSIRYSLEHDGGWLVYHPFNGSPFRVDMVES